MTTNERPPLSKLLLALKMPVSRVMMKTATWRRRTNCHHAGCNSTRLRCQCPWAGHELDARAAYQTEMTGLALSPGDVPPGLRVFLDGVANFFARTVNLERQSQAVAQSTFLKARERMLCKCTSMNVTFTTPHPTCFISVCSSQVT